MKKPQKAKKSKPASAKRKRGSLPGITKIGWQYYPKGNKAGDGFTVYRENKTGLVYVATRVTSGKYPSLEDIPHEEKLAVAKAA